MGHLLVLGISRDIGGRQDRVLLIESPNDSSRRCGRQLRGDLLGRFRHPREPWGRVKDNIGIGYAFLDGGNGDVRKTQVLETYYRFVFNDHMAVTADLQYMDDELVTGSGPEGYIVGLRATAEF